MFGLTAIVIIISHDTNNKGTLSTIQNQIVLLLSQIAVQNATVMNGSAQLRNKKLVLEDQTASNENITEFEKTFYNQNENLSKTTNSNIRRC